MAVKRRAQSEAWAKEKNKMTKQKVFEILSEMEGHRLDDKFTANPGDYIIRIMEAIVANHCGLKDIDRARWKEYFKNEAAQ